MATAQHVMLHIVATPATALSAAYGPDKALADAIALLVAGGWVVATTQANQATQVNTGE